MSILDKASLIQIPSGYKSGTLYSIKPSTANPTELVTNGDFSSNSDWTLTSSANITNGKLNVSAGAFDFFAIQTALVNGDFYKISIEVTVTSGSVLLYTGGQFATITSSGVYNYNFTSDSTQIRFRSSGSGFVGSIDNVSVKRAVSADGDFDFSRSSSATRVNSEGLIEVAQIVSTTEEVTNGDFSGVANGTDVVTLSGWGTYGSVTSRNIESEQLKLVSPLGTTNVGVVLSVSTTSGSLYRFTYSASGDLGVNGIYIDGVGAYNSSTEKNITFTATSSTTYIYFRPGENNGGTAYFDNVSVKEVFENDVPRLDYSDGSCPSLLLEPQRTNLINYSESLLGTNRTGTYTVNAAISPDGTQNATKITATTTDPFFYQSVTLNAATYTASLWVKGVGSSIGKEFRFAISNQTHVGNRYTIPSEWTRFEFTASVNAGSVTTGVEIPDPAVVGDEVLVWGWQVEESSFATSYIPSNSGSATTRVADVCDNAGTSATFNSTEGVLFAEIAALNEVGDGTTRLSISDGTQDNNVTIGYSATNTLRTIIRSGASNQALMTSSQTITNYLKVAVKYKANDFALWVNGVKVATDTSGLAPVGLSELSFDRGDAALPFYGKVKQLITFNEALSSEELADLTGQVNTSFVQLANFYNYTIL